MAKRGIALIALLLLVLTGCGKVYAGTWCCAYMETGTSTLTAGDLRAAGTDLCIELKYGGSGIMTADGESQYISWSAAKDGGSLWLTVDGQREQFFIEDGALVWDMNGTTVRFLPENSAEYEAALESYSVLDWAEEQ